MTRVLFFLNETWLIALVHDVRKQVTLAKLVLENLRHLCFHLQIQPSRALILI